MSASAFSIREYRTEDEAEVLGLLHQSLGNGRAFERTSAFWQWKHFQNPFGLSLMVVAAHGQILGLRAFMRWRFRAGVHEMMAVRAVDTATHPASRRQGIFSTLTRRTVELAQAGGVDLIFNTPNRLSLPGYLKLGWSHVGRPQLLVRILRPRRVALGLLMRARQNGEDRSAPTVSAAPSEALLSRPDTLAQLISENDRLCAGSIRTDRSVAFIRWRYAATPSLAYYACWRGTDPETAVAIFRPNQRHGLREIMICELLLSTAGVPDVPHVIRCLTDAVDADYLVAHAPRRSVHRRALRMAGFVPIPGLGPNLTVRPLSLCATAVSATSINHWHLTLGDLEVF